jgi:hypothetical protein
MVTTEDPRRVTEPGWARRFRAAAIELSALAIDAPEVALVSF